MKILVLGANGMAGHTICLYLKEQNYDVTAYTRSPFPYCKNIIGNAFNTTHFLQIIQEGCYDVIINCIGILNKEAEESTSNAVYLNSYLPHLICNILKSQKTKLIHMSTDCVFLGNTGPYNEMSLKDGTSFYDRSKALGEVCDNKNLTFRNSIIGPDIDSNGIGLFNWFMKQTGSILGYTHAIWTGVTTYTLAKAMKQAIEDNLTGLYNLVNNDNISKFDLLNLINKHFRNDIVKIKPANKLKLDKTLINTRNDFSFVIPSYEQQIIEMKNWIYKRKDLYPHYFE